MKKSATAELQALHYERFRKALEPFEVEESKKDRAAKTLCKYLDRFGSAHDDLTESQGYLDFYGKAKELSSRLSNNGLTFDKWVEVCFKNPLLFTHSPDRTEKKIRGVVNAFKSEGLTLEEYLAMPSQEPSRFVESPKIIE